MPLRFLSDAQREQLAGLWADLDGEALDERRADVVLGLEPLCCRDLAGRPDQQSGEHDDDSRQDEARYSRT